MSISDYGLLKLWKNGKTSSSDMIIKVIASVIQYKNMWLYLQIFKKCLVSL